LTIEQQRLPHRLGFAPSFYPKYFLPKVLAAKFVAKRVEGNRTPRRFAFTNSEVAIDGQPYNLLCHEI